MDLSNSMPTQGCPGCLCRSPRIVDLLAEQSLEVLRKHRRRTSFYDFADLRAEPDAAEAGKAPHTGKQDVDDEPFDIVVCTSGHAEMANQAWIACCPPAGSTVGTLIRASAVTACAHFESNPSNRICEGPSLSDRFNKNPTFECPARGTIFAKTCLLVFLACHWW